MAAVGGRVDQDIFRFGLQSALDDSLEVFVFDLKFLEGEVVHINNEAVVAVFHFGQDPLQVAELMLVDLDHAQAPVVILVEDGLDAGGFAGSGIPVEQDVVGGPAADKGLGIGDQSLLLQFVADQIVQDHVAGGCDGDQEVVLSCSRVIHRGGRARFRYGSL